MCGTVTEYYATNLFYRCIFPSILINHVLYYVTIIHFRANTEESRTHNTPPPLTPNKWANTSWWDNSIVISCIYVYLHITEVLDCFDDDHYDDDLPFITCLSVVSRLFTAIIYTLHSTHAHTHTHPSVCIIYTDARNLAAYE